MRLSHYILEVYENKRLGNLFKLKNGNQLKLICKMIIKINV